MTLQEELRKFLDVFEPYARGYFKERVKSVSFYPPLIKKFYQDLADFSSGGKKMRPFLVYLGTMVGSQKVNLTQILPICLSSEIAHSFLLIHDDIIDQSDIRRGKPTIHARYEKNASAHYGMSQAIILGDVAFLESLKLINSSKFDDKSKTVGIKMLLDVLLETTYGQALDIEYSLFGADLAKVRQVIDLKTARYSFVGPLVIGAILSKASATRISGLRKFGLLAGCAFQLQDDILGVFGDEKILGKSVLSDMREGKNTILIHKAKQMAKGRDRVDIERIWGSPEATSVDLVKMKRIIEKSGALKWCSSENRKLAAGAKKEVEKITPDKRLRIILAQIADFVILRQK